MSDAAAPARRTDHLDAPGGRTSPPRRRALGLLRDGRWFLSAAGLIVLLTLAIAAGILLDQWRLSLDEHRLVQRAHAVGRELSAVLAAQIAGAPGQSLGAAAAGGRFAAQVGRQLAHSPEIGYVEVIDAAGEIVWSTGASPAISRHWLGGTPSSFLAGGRQRTRVPQGSGDEADIFMEMATVVGPAGALAPPTGAIVLGLSTARVSETLRRGFWQSVSILALGGVLLLAGLGWGYLVLARRRGEAIRRRAREEHLAELGMLAAGLAHEVRNPLNAIRFAVDSLRHRAARADAPGVGAEMVGISGEIASEVEDLEHLVSSFLAYARPPQGAPEPCDVVAVCRSAAAVVQGPARDRAVELTCELPAEGLGAELEPGRLRQVLVNLLLNAVQACGAGDRVELGAWADDEQVHLRVEDSGQGVPLALRRQLFEPFTTGRAEGTGLGLAICRRLVEEMAGDLVYEPIEPRGSRFMVTLPCRPANRREERPR